MKYILTPLLFFILITESSAQLNYQLVTTGLTSVTFEIGYSEIEIADMNNDGHPDILTIGDHGSPNFSATEAGIMVFRNNGSGTSYSLVKTGNFGYGGIAVGDVNNDGHKDVGYAMHHNYSTSDFGDQLIEVALGNSTAQNWTPYDDNLATNGETYGMFGIDFADVNNDGLLDLGANSFGCCAGLHVYKNNGNGTWTQTDGVTGGNAKHWLKFGDFNRDGKVDLSTASEWGVIWSNDGTGYFTSMQNGFPNDWYIEYDLADINHDGAQDIALVSNNQLMAYTYNVQAGMWQSISNGLPSNSTFEGVSLYDMDNDGFQDIVTWATGVILVYKGNGGSSWSQMASIPITETQFSCMNTADLNHDGLGDIIYMAKTSQMNSDNYLKVYLSQSANMGLSIAPVFPNGNECFATNSVQFLTWSASVPQSTTATVTIDYSSSGPNGPFANIAQNIPNSGTYQWTTPIFSSNNCYLRYTITNGNSTQITTTTLPFGIGDCSQLPTSAEENLTDGFDFSFYPNPASTELFLDIMSSGNEKVIVEMRNNLGQELYAEELEPFTGHRKLSISLIKIPAGAYLISIGNEGKTQARRFIVIR